MSGPLFINVLHLTALDPRYHMSRVKKDICLLKQKKVDMAWNQSEQWMEQT